MPRIGRGPYLWLDQQRTTPTWFVKDGRARTSTRCSACDREGAQLFLEQYCAQKRLNQTAKSKRAAAQVLVADVIAYYSSKKQAKQARPNEVRARLTALLDFFGKKKLSELDSDLYEKFVETHGAGAARRMLEDLRAALNLYHKKNLVHEIIAVELPARGHARQGWLTRDQAATLVRHCWRYRAVHNGEATGRHSRRHLARFILAAIYTTRRKGALVDTQFGPALDRPWVNFDTGEMIGKPLPRDHKKRQPTIKVPRRLLAHMRRWAKNGQRSLVELNGEAVHAIDKGFAVAVDACGLPADIVIHSLRHTGITWLALEGKASAYQICRFAGITEDVFWDVYAHHNARYMGEIDDGFSKHRDHIRDHNGVNKRERTAQNVVDIKGKSTAAT